MDGAEARDAVKRRAHESALEVFRRLPLVVRRLTTRAIAPGFAVGAVAVSVDEQQRVLLVKSRHQRAWSLPGGLLKRGESPEAAVVRELGEELGVAVAIERLDRTPRVVVDPESHQVTVIFRLTLDDRPVADGVETQRLDWYAASDLPAALLRGTRESLALVGFLDR